MTIYISIWRHWAWRCGQFTALLVTGNNSPLRNQNKDNQRVVERKGLTLFQNLHFLRESQKRRVNFKLVKDEAKFGSKQNPELERMSKKFQINVTTCFQIIILKQFCSKQTHPRKVKITNIFICHNFNVFLFIFWVGERILFKLNLEMLKYLFSVEIQFHNSWNTVVFCLSDLFQMKIQNDAKTHFNLHFWLICLLNFCKFSAKSS